MYTYNEIIAGVLGITIVIIAGTWFAAALIRNGK